MIPKFKSEAMNAFFRVSIVLLAGIAIHGGVTGAAEAPPEIVKWKAQPDSPGPAANATDHRAGVGPVSAEAQPCPFTYFSK